MNLSQWQSFKDSEMVKSNSHKISIAEKFVNVPTVCAVQSFQNRHQFWPIREVFYRDYLDFGHCITHSKAVGD